MMRRPIWSVMSSRGSAYTATPSTSRMAFAANDTTVLARPVMLR